MIIHKNDARAIMFLTSENFKILTICSLILAGAIFIAFHFSIIENEKPFMISSYKEYFYTARHYLPSFIFLEGINIALLTFIIFYLQRKSRLYADKEIEDKNKALKGRLDFQNMVMNNVPDLIFVKDEKFRIINANDAFLSIYPENVRHKVIGSTTIEHFKRKEADEFLSNDRLAFEEGINEVEETIHMPSGNIKTLHTKKVRFENTKKQKFILGIARDITHQKHTENEIIRSNRELESFLNYSLNVVRAEIQNKKSIMQPI
ncbi:MAG: PAS domain-containing protein [Pseudomonadota bacterium]